MLKFLTYLLVSSIILIILDKYSVPYLPFKEYLGYHSFYYLIFLFTPWIIAWKKNLFRREWIVAGIILTWTLNDVLWFIVDYEGWLGLWGFSNEELWWDLWIFWMKFKGTKLQMTVVTILRFILGVFILVRYRNPLE